MKIEIPTTKTVDIRRILIKLPVDYGEEDIPNNFPLRVGDKWVATVDVDTGQIAGWPQGKLGYLHMKVCDGGSYTLFDERGNTVADTKEGYVPHGVVPGEYGDYVILEINEDGIITNWPKKPDFSEFFKKEDE